MGRTEKGIKNIIFGFGAQFVTTLLTFLSRTIMLKCVGFEVVSLNSLFKEVVMVMSLAELGIGSAIVYNLYKPLAENDQEKICQLMSFFKQAYRVIALTMLGIGCIVCIFIPSIVKDLSLDTVFMRCVFMLFVINTASSYLFSYKISLLNADQNNYVYSIYSTIFNVIKIVLGLFVLWTTNNYIVYLIYNVFATLFVNFVISRQVDKRYLYLHDAVLPKEERKKIFENVKNIFIKELSGKITSSTDNILTSIMVSTIMVGKYSFYSTVFAVFKQFVEKIEAGIKAGMGNLFASGTNEECEHVLYRLTWGYGVIATFSCTCIYACCQSFIIAWVGEEYLLQKYVLCILVINLFCYIISKPIYSAMHVAGFFVQGRNISIIGSTVNLVVSLIFSYFTGIFGIFLGTFCTYFIQIVMKVYYVYKLKFKKSFSLYAFYLIRFFALTLLLMLVCDWVLKHASLSLMWADFVVKGLVSALVSITILWGLFHKTSEFEYYKHLVLKYMKRIKKK